MELTSALERELAAFRRHDWGLNAGNIEIAPHLVNLVGGGRPDVALENLFNAFEVLKDDHYVEAEFAALGIGVTGKTTGDRWAILLEEHGKTEEVTMRRWAERGRPRLIKYLIDRYGGWSQATFEGTLSRVDDSYELSVRFDRRVISNSPDFRGRWNIRVYPENADPYDVPDGEMDNFTIHLRRMTRWHVSYETDTWDRPWYSTLIRGEGLSSVNVDIQDTRMVVMVFVNKSY